MKLNKLFSVLGLASVLSFTACTDEVDYTPAPAVNTPGVYFSSEEEVNFTIDAETGVQTINIYRQKTDGELSVAIQTSGDADKVSVPSTVTFPAGAESATVAITPLVATMEDFTTYALAITVDDAFATPYLPNTWEGTFTYANGEEWITIGECEFTDDAIGPLYGLPVLSWPVEIQEHYETPGLYRLVNPYGCEAAPLHEYCTLSENYVIVNATNPAKVFFGDNANAGFDTGLNVGDGLLRIGLQAYGSLNDGKIMWPVKGLAVFIGQDGYYANNSGQFCIDLSVIK